MKSRLAVIKSVFVAGWVMGAIVLVTPLSISKAAALRADDTKGNAASNPADYAGSEACMA